MRLILRNHSQWKAYKLSRLAMFDSPNVSLILVRSFCYRIRHIDLVILFHHYSLLWLLWKDYHRRMASFSMLNQIPLSKVVFALLIRTSNQIKEQKIGGPALPYYPKFSIPPTLWMWDKTKRVKSLCVLHNHLFHRRRIEDVLVQHLGLASSSSFQRYKNQSFCSINPGQELQRRKLMTFYLVSSFFAKKVSIICLEPQKNLRHRKYWVCLLRKFWVCHDRLYKF